ncbi:transposase [Frigoriglobus tundricola]|uniref:transposase n=1 Tax=Frigoriglobus tundricola TaxID=2774151 RepID=UPI00148E95CD|nr:transposase [Frigoriglobus tundricola]
MFSDATILTQTPPLRACWSKIGEQAEVPITGNRDHRVVFGALNARTGAVWLDEAAQWNQDAFQEHLRSIRSWWRGWKLVLVVARGSPHTAKRSRQLAAQSGIEMRFLPTACPELNSVEGLWRHVKGRVLANEPTPDLSQSLGRVHDELFQMTPTQHLRLAGVLSGSFWLPA